MRNIIYFKTFIFFGMLFSYPCLIFAHEGHDHEPVVENNIDPNQAIVITDQAKRNLGLITVTAEVETIDHTVIVYGQVEAIPQNTAIITSRIKGRVYSLAVDEGSIVKKGQTLITVESLQVGNPPPQVSYVSPIDGIITERNVLPGDAVETNKALLEIVDLESLYVVGRLYENKISSITRGQKVKVSIESFPDLLFDGIVEMVSGKLDPHTRTLKVWTRIANPNANILPNMRASLEIVTNQSAKSVVIPRSAVLGQSGEFFVFVESKDDQYKFFRRDVVLGKKNNLYIEIIKGIEAGEKVATIGAYQMQFISPRSQSEQEQNDHGHDH